MTAKTILLPALALGLLAACAPTDRPGPGFGSAVRQNIAAQVVNPMPSPDMNAPDFSGARAAGAMDRYHASKVIPPVTVTTTDVGGK